jgi:hypothetical protein
MMLIIKDYSFKMYAHMHLLYGKMQGNDSAAMSQYHEKIHNCHTTTNKTFLFVYCQLRQITTVPCKMQKRGVPAIMLLL